MSTERELLRLAQETAMMLVTTARLAVEGRDGRRQEVQLANITDVVVGATGSGTGAGYAVRVQHWRPGPALVVEVDDEGEARRLAQAIVAAARAISLQITACSQGGVMRCCNRSRKSCPRRYSIP